METPPDESQHNTFRKNRDGAYALAAGLLWQDRKRLLPYTVLLALPGILAVSLHYSTDWVVGLEVLGRCITLFVLFSVGSHLLESFGHDTLNASPRFPRLLLAGFLFWGLFALPLSLLMVAPGALGTVALFLLIPAIALGLRFYFYFFPILLGHTSSKHILEEAATFTKHDSLLGLKAVIGPLGLMLVVIAASRSLSPDARSMPLNMVIEYLSSLFPLLTIYLGMSFCLSLLPESKWSSLGLTPYHRERFETVRLNSPPWLAKSLRPQAGILFVLFGSFIWLSNDLRASQMPPSVALTLEEVTVEESTLTALLVIGGNHEELSHFHPASLRLAGEKGTSISEKIPVIRVDGQELPFSTRLHELEATGGSPMYLEATFETSLPKEELAKIGDMYLWYRNYRLMNILVPVDSDSQEPA